MKRLRFAPVGLTLALLACTESHAMPDSGLDSGGHDAFVETRDAGIDATIAPPPGAIVCGGAICGDGEECCLLDARCVAIGDPSCAPPTGTDVPRACVRNSDCAADELCDLAEGATFHLCTGVVGSCRARDAATCGWEGDGVCGCDGRTYEDTCAAAEAGVRVGARAPCGRVVSPDIVAPEPCGGADTWCGGDHAHCDDVAGVCVPDDPVIACGLDAQCPVGQACCAITGLCFDPARPDACAVPPEGTRAPCADDTDCERLDGSWWPFLTSGGDTFCGGPGCGPAGGCVVPDACDGVLDPVCGCDGLTYQNACEATRAHVRVDHPGAC